MFGRIVSQLANKVIVPALAKSKPMVAAATKAHEAVQVAARTYIYTPMDQG